MFTKMRLTDPMPRAPAFASPPGRWCAQAHAGADRGALDPCCSWRGATRAHRRVRGHRQPSDAPTVQAFGLVFLVD